MADAITDANATLTQLADAIEDTGCTWHGQEPLTSWLTQFLLFLG